MVDIIYPNKEKREAKRGKESREQDCRMSVKGLSTKKFRKKLKGT